MRTGYATVRPCSYLRPALYFDLFTSSALVRLPSTFLQIWTSYWSRSTVLVEVKFRSKSRWVKNLEHFCISTRNTKMVQDMKMVEVQLELIRTHAQGLFHWPKIFAKVYCNLINTPWKNMSLKKLKWYFSEIEINEDDGGDDRDPNDSPKDFAFSVKMIFIFFENDLHFLFDLNFYFWPIFRFLTNI